MSPISPISPISASGAGGALDVVGIGNALVDVLAHEDDGFLVRHRLVKGAMALIDAESAEQLYAVMAPATEISGGSAANTMVGIASFGGRAAFVGRVRDDQLGAVFAHDIRAAGVTFDTTPAVDGVPSGRCLIVVTPDAERTLNTFLGAAAEIGPADIDPELIGAAQVTYLEGYLFDQPRAKEPLHCGGQQISTVPAVKVFVIGNLTGGEIKHSGELCVQREQYERCQQDHVPNHPDGAVACGTAAKEFPSHEGQRGENE